MVAPLMAALMISTPARGQVLCQSEADDVAALRSFNAAVTEYVELHRRLDTGMSPLYVCSDPALIARGVADLADAIRAERRGAAAGDIFEPEIADLIRFRLLTARGRAVRPGLALPEGLGEDGEGCAAAPAVNASFAWEGSAGIGDLDRLLPGLPPELAFRFVGRALVLVDVPAGLVVDVLEQALP